MVRSSSRSTANPTVPTAPARKRLQPSDGHLRGQSVHPPRLQKPIARHLSHRPSQAAILACFLTAINNPNAPLILSATSLDELWFWLRREAEVLLPTVAHVRSFSRLLMCPRA